MGSNEHNEQSDRHDELARQIVDHLTSGGAGGTIGPDGVSLGIPNWEERTKDQRFSERVKTHGYPLGFAKSQWHLRDRLRERRRTENAALAEEQKLEAERVHDVVAFALDAERVLGSFNYTGDDRFPVDTVDRVAGNLLLWLDHRGYAVVPREPHTDDEPLPEVGWHVPNVFDNARRTFLLWRENSSDPV